ncbi:hypothetical protein C2G38_970392 [Gigaspora rosea]|uniref:Uncharacterized protein n=1 Tax=Gigaspora rosea TaxID=44941 RepID=A0A397W502_9GLOM|nr:hypothetical protein C2G38_970392 [Gigaspora rosea]
MNISVVFIVYFKRKGLLGITNCSILDTENAIGVDSTAVGNRLGGNLKGFFLAEM